MIKLTSSQVAGLLDQPETGMGYQTVQVSYRDGRAPRTGTVLNAELLMWEAERRTLLSTPLEALLGQAGGEEATKFRSLEVLTRARTAAGSIAEASPTADHEGPAADGDPEATGAGELCARFTAYQNDRRITPRKGLRPGTYATTEKDANRVATGSAAVERYALPDPRPAIFRFKIDPPQGTLLRRGIVQPAFGHQGGGVEVLFDTGTADGTVSGPQVLPP